MIPCFPHYVHLDCYFHFTYFNSSTLQLLAHCFVFPILSCEREHGIMYYFHTLQVQWKSTSNFGSLLCVPHIMLSTWAWHDVLLTHTPIKCNGTQLQLLAHCFAFLVLSSQHEHGMMYYFHTLQASAIETKFCFRL